MEIDGILYCNNSVTDVRQLDGTSKTKEVWSKAIDSKHESTQRGGIHGVGSDIGSDVDKMEVWMADEQFEHAFDLFFFPNRFFFAKCTANISVSFGVIQTHHRADILEHFFGFYTTKGDVLRLVQIHQYNVR